MHVADARVLADIDFGSGKHDPVARVDAALDGNDARRVDGNLARLHLVKKLGGDVGKRSHRLRRPLLEGVLRGHNRREAARVDDARFSHRHALRGDEKEVAAHGVADDAVDGAVDLDARFNKVEKVAGRPRELEVDDVVLRDRKLGKAVDADLAVGHDLLGRDVGDVSRG